MMLAFPSMSGRPRLVTSPHLVHPRVQLPLNPLALIIRMLLKIILLRQCWGDSCPAEVLPISNAAGSCSAGSQNTSTIAAASDDVGSESEMSRGFLLAVKLWQEALATVTVAGAAKSAAHSHA